MTPHEKLSSRSWRLRNSSWFLSPILSVGMGTGASFIYIGIRARRRPWILAGIAYVGVFAAYLVLRAVSGNSSTHETNTQQQLAWIMIVLWIAGIVHGTFANRGWLRFKAHRADDAWYNQDDEYDVANAATSSPGPASAPQSQPPYTTATVSSIAVPAGSGVVTPETAESH